MLTIRAGQTGGAAAVQAGYHPSPLGEGDFVGVSGDGFNHWSRPGYSLGPARPMLELAAGGPGVHSAMESGHKPWRAMVRAISSAWEANRSKYRADFYPKCFHDRHLHRTACGEGR